MAKRKPKAKPIAGKVPAAAPVTIEMPLLRDDVARDAWRHVTGLLLAKGIITPRDRDIITVYCDCWSQYVEARRNVADSGPVTETDKGNQVLSPWAIQEGRLRMHLLRLQQQLGMTPAARAKVKSEGGDGEGEFAALLT